MLRYMQLPAFKATHLFRHQSPLSWWKSSSSGDNVELSFDFRKITKLQHVLNFKIDSWAHHDSPTNIVNEACNAMQSIAEESHKKWKGGKMEAVFEYLEIVTGCARKSFMQRICGRYAMHFLPFQSSTSARDSLSIESSRPVAQSINETNVSQRGVRWLSWLTRRVQAIRKEMSYKLLWNVWGGQSFFASRCVATLATDTSMHCNELWLAYDECASL